MKWLWLLWLLLLPCLVSAQTEFGKTTTGGSARSILDYGQALVGTGYTYTAQEGDQITAVYAHCKRTGGAKYFDIMVYSMPSGTIDGGSRLAAAETVLADTAYGWYGATGLSLSLTAGVEYAIAIGQITGTITVRYDTEDAGELSYDNDQEDLPATWGETGTSSAAICVKAVVTNTGGGSTGQVIIIQ